MGEPALHLDCCEAVCMRETGFPLLPCPSPSMAGRRAVPHESGTNGHVPIAAALSRAGTTSHLGSKVYVTLLAEAVRELA